MAGIYKKAGTRNWYCTYVEANGAKVHRSTSERVRKDAMRKAVSWEEEAEMLRNTNDERQKEMLSVLREATDKARRGELSLDDGRELIGRIVEISTGEKMRFYSVGEWFEEWLSEKKNSVKESTYRSYTATIRRVLDFLGEETNKGIEFLQAEELRAYRDWLHKGGRTAKTCNMHFKALRMSLAEAQRRGLVRRNEAEGIPPLRETDSRVREPFTADEVEKLLGVSDDDWRAMILLGFYGGLRLRDASNLRWQNIDLKAGVMKFTPKKTEAKKRTLTVPLHPRLIECLRKRKGRKTEGYVFLNLCERESGGSRGLSYDFAKIMKKAGVSRGRDEKEEGGGHRKGLKSFHSLRHTYTSLLASAGVPEEVRMKLVGHTTADVHRVYTHHEVDNLRDAVDLLPEI